MSILTQNLPALYSQFFDSDLLSQLISPFASSYSVFDYGLLMSQLSSSFHSLVLHSLKLLLEEKDRAFRNRPGRVQRYYVKQTRNRTIITPFGELTFRRTEYVDKATHVPFCPVDRAIGLDPRIRYDALVQAMIYEEYANSNSMIKVGQHIGDRIFHHFSLDASRHRSALSRQTVYNILHRLGVVHVPVSPRPTPSTLYIMADEKWIPLQSRSADQPDQPQKLMVKSTVIFEGVEPIPLKNGLPSKRNRLVGKHYIAAAQGENIWTLTLDALSQRYDLTQVKQIFILGDGASWIKNGRSELRGMGPQVTFALDRFHFSQAIIRVTNDKDLQAKLFDYAKNDMKPDFFSALDSLAKQKENPSPYFLNSVAYLKNHWNDYQTMIKQVQIGCAMEQVISHVFASNFTSVPKAYDKNNLPRYVNSRILFQNQLDLRQTYLRSLDYSRTHRDQKDINLNEDFYDSSLFDKASPDDPYPVHLPHFGEHTNTKF